MLELGLSGSVRGVPSNGHPYRNPQDERDVLALQIGHPGIADELTVTHQGCDLEVRKRRAQAIEKLGALCRV